MTQGVTRLGAAGSQAAAGAAAEAIGAAAAGQAAAENFPVALRVLPARYRGHLQAVYGFARAVDDMGDEAPPGERTALLDELEADLGRLYRGLGAGAAGAAATGATAAARGDGAPGEPGPGGAVTGGQAGGQAGPSGEGPPRISVVRALAPVVTGCGVPRQLFADLIQANRQDQVVTRYASYGDLLGYCELSANPVGRIVLRVFGVSSPRHEELSDRVCTALQLAEHWQDVAEDLRAGRIYLPGEDLDRFGVTEADLAGPVAGPRVRALMAFEVQRARRLLDAGAPLVGNLRGAARVAVAGYVAGGRAALAAIAAAGHDVLRATPRPARRRLAREVLRAYAAGR